MNTKTNSPTPWNGLSPCDAYESGYQHGGYDAAERSHPRLTTRIAELEAAYATCFAERRDAEHAATAALDRVAELEAALIAFCDADLANLQERSACRRQAYDALLLTKSDK